MQQDVLWAPWDAPGLEHLRLTATRRGLVADGVVVGLGDAGPFRLRYLVRCDPQWRVRRVDLALTAPVLRRLALWADGEGRWTTPRGAPLPSLDGCVDVDIAVTPFTNTLPIRRLALLPGRSTEVTVAYVPVPDLRPRRAKQRYTCLEAEAAGARYRYEGLDTGFTADLAVDADGLVVDYPGLVRRVWPR